MAKRGKREVRHTVLKGFFGSYNKGYMDDEAIKSNLESSNVTIYESEVEQFAKDNPEVNIQEFVEWTKKFGVYKIAGKKSTTGVGRLTLKSPDKAKELGVADADVEKFTSIMSQIFDLTEAANELVPGKKLNHYFSEVKAKTEKEVAQPA